MSTVVLFHRDYKKFTGGHLKLWHYYNHTKSFKGYQSRIFFTKQSTFDGTNPWLHEKDNIIEKWDIQKADVLFLEGMDWSFLNREELASSQIPIINLIQHVQHADPDNPRYQFLKEKAIRICVSKEVEHALRKANTVNGPIRTIPNGIDFNELPQSVPLEKRDIDVLVVGIKQWNMTKRIEFLTSVLNLFSSVFKKTKFKFIKKLISRNEFLKHLANSKNCIFLPARTEGFYLPALESMYLQTRVIVPDCVGNRGFCYDNVNCYMPEYSLKGIFYSLIKALKATPEEHKDMINQAYIFAQKHSIDNEREQYKILLQNVCTLWNEAT